MLRVNWQDQELKVRAYTSLTGDLIKLGTTTEYPFVSGGTQGAPFGWSPYYENGGVYTDVSFTTGSGRFSIGNVGTDIHGSKRYGIYKDFPVTPGKYYLISVQCRTTQGRSHAIRYVRFANGNNHSYLKLNQMWSFQDWENIVVNAANYASTGILRVNLTAAPYTLDPKGIQIDANWGIQFQSVTINEQDATYPMPTWHEITCDTKQVSIHYGRDKFTSRYNSATATVNVDNQDSYYTYGNGNADDLRPGRLLKITLTLPNTTTELPMYYGVIDSFADKYDIDGSALVQLSCIDTSSLLATMTVPTMHSRDDIVFTGARFNALMDGVGFLFSFKTYSYTSFDQQAIVASGRSARDEAGIIADSEGGWFFVSRTGILTLMGRRWPQYNSRLTTVQAELLATPTRQVPIIDDVPTVPNVPIVELRMLATDWSRDRIINDVSIANQDGTAFRYQDFASQKKNGPFTYQRLDYVNDNAQEPLFADQRATDLMDGYSDPILRVNSVEFVPTPETFEWCAKAFLEELVRVRYEHPKNGWGWASATHIQGYVHTFTPKSWGMSIALDHPESFAFYETADGSGWDVSYWDIDLWDEFGIEGGYWDSGQVWGDANYLSPTIGTVTTPTPGPLPSQFTLVYEVLGPTVASNGAVASQFDTFGKFSWIIYRNSGTGYQLLSVYPQGDVTNATTRTVSSMNPSANPDRIALSVDNRPGNPLQLTSRKFTNGAWQLESTQDTGASVTPFVSTDPVRIGSTGGDPSGTVFNGRIYSVELRTGLDPNAGTVIWRFDANEWNGGSTFTDARGRVWTLTNPSAIVGTPMNITQIWGE
jgi:hypothetical protein